MENNLITEISKIHKMMGVSLINEGKNPLSSLLKLVIGTLDETTKGYIKNLIDGTLDSTGKQELITLFKSDEGETIITNLKNQISKSTDRVATSLAKKELKMIEDLVKLGVKKTGLQIDNLIKSAKQQLKSDTKFTELIGKATNPSQATKSVETFLENGIRSGKSFSKMYRDCITQAKKAPGVKQAIHDARIEKLKNGLDYINILGWKGNVGVLAVVYLWSQDIISFEWVQKALQKLGSKFTKEDPALNNGTTPEKPANGGGSGKYSGL
jgi:hypothetical protein